MKRPINQLISLVMLVFVGLVVHLQPGVLAGHDREAMRDQHSGAPSGPAQPPPGADYLSIPGASFVPACTLDHLADAEGGVAITGGSSCKRMVAPVLLPDGALIYGMDLHFYDNTSGRLQAHLWRQNPHTLSASGFVIYSPWPAVGYDTTGHHGSGPLLSVNNRRYNYQVDVEWSSASANLWLMGVTIVYTHP